MSKKFMMSLSAVCLTLSSAAASIAAEVNPIQSENIKLQGRTVQVPTYKWSDAAVPAKAVLLAIHGGVQHGGVYKALAEKLAPLGIVVYSIDLYGHGQWLFDSPTPVHLNYRASTDDLLSLTKELRDKYPGLPLFCIGESLGASMALHGMNVQPNLFDGAILASPGTSLHLNPDVGPVFHSIVQGAKSLGKSIDLSPYLTHISDDPRSNKETLTDPRNRRTSSVGELIHSAKFVRENPKLASSLNPAVPILVLQGDKDEICSVKSVDSLYSRFASSDKSLKTFKGVGHLLVTTEYLKPEVVSTVESWLEQHMAAPSISQNKTSGPDSKTASAD